MTSLQFTHVQGQGYTRGKYSLVQGKGEDKGMHSTTLSIFMAAFLDLSIGIKCWV